MPIIGVRVEREVYDVLGEPVLSNNVSLYEYVKGY